MKIEGGLRGREGGRGVRNRSGEPALAMGIQDKSMSYMSEKYNKTHKFVQLINGNQKKKYSNLGGEIVRAKGIVIINLENLNGTISYGGFIR